MEYLREINEELIRLHRRQLTFLEHAGFGQVRDADLRDYASVNRRIEELRLELKKILANKKFDSD